MDFLYNIEKLRKKSWKILLVCYDMEYAALKTKACLNP